jgi:hypothetical protein
LTNSWMVKGRQRFGIGWLDQAASARIEFTASVGFNKSHQTCAEA